MFQGQPLHPLKHALHIFTATSKEGWGAHLVEYTCKGSLVPSRKQVAHELPGTKGGHLGPKRVPRPLLEPNNTHS